ncbi:MAG: class I SAM-dependent DNA methyltransferase [Acidobacteriia bacterium]|nr:class I SAM-dependent DNA methyltransferase [Terriglobia bacterium]
MNAVEIEEAVSALAECPFEGGEFPFEFLQSFGNKATTVKRLRSGASNSSDLGGVLQRSNIHIKVCAEGEAADTLAALKASPATSRARAKFVLATDGREFHAEDLNSGDVIVCHYSDFPEHFGFFLPLAGITTVKQIRESAFDIKATGRLNRLYVELLKENPTWGSADRRSEMNHFMARLIFCFFAEDTDIFNVSALFTNTIERMSAADSSNTHVVIGEIFRTMNTDTDARKATDIPRWASSFPYVNGGLFSDLTEVPRFSRIARSYLLHIGNLDWKKINPDIFGSMIQAVADDEERGALGMHYTSVPNILKVLNPLFLDDLRQKLEDAGTSSRKLLNLRNRMARIRVFDPACGSGNFLVIAYKEIRAIEAEINQRRRESGRRSDIPLTNFRGIELHDFPAEIARLALVIAEYQCDVLYRGQREALAEFLPLDAMNWITCGNSLRLDWLDICPPTGTGVKLTADDLFATPLDQAEIDFENEGGETYICGNPPYVGSTWQSRAQKSDLEGIFAVHTRKWKSLDYVAAWFMKAAHYGMRTQASTAFVSTNSICQGQQVPILWPLIFSTGHVVTFAHTSFKWANLASHNAGVTVVIVGISRQVPKLRSVFSNAEDGEVSVLNTENINAYLVSGPDIIVRAIPKTPIDRAPMVWGNKPTDGGNLVLSSSEKRHIEAEHEGAVRYVRPYLGAAEYIRGLERFCIWVEDNEAAEARKIAEFSRRFDRVREFRASSKAAETRPASDYPHRFRQIQSVAERHTLIMPKVSSEGRQYLPVGLLPQRAIVSDLAFALYDAPLWNMALAASRLHLVWIATICGKLETRFRYSNTLGWNTFPVPSLTTKNRADLTACAENILLAREAHFPATIAQLYDRTGMPDNLRGAHERNDEVVERIYIGRRFRNDTERLEKLFELYVDTTTREGAA